MIMFEDFSDLERALIVATKYKSHFDDAEPEVGFGPFIDDQLDTVIEAVGVVIAPDRLRIMKKYLTGWRYSSVPGRH